MIQTIQGLHIAQTHSPIEGAPSRSRQMVVRVMVSSMMQTVDPDVFRIPSVPTRHSPAADFLNLGRFDGIRNLYHPIGQKSRDQRD